MERPTDEEFEVYAQEVTNNWHGLVYAGETYAQQEFYAMMKEALADDDVQAAVLALEGLSAYLALKESL